MPKNTPGRIIDERARVSASFIGGGGAGTGVSDHGLLSGLTDDDHLHYLTNGRGDLRYVPLARTVTAGNGLSGGGALSGNISLALASSAAGDGLTYASGVLAVGVSGLGLSVAADAVTLTSSSNPGANARVLASTAAGALTLQQLMIGTAVTLNGGNSVASAPDIQFASSGLVAADDNLHLNADASNTGTGGFIFAKGTATSAATVLARLTNAGRFGVGSAAPSYELDVTGTGRATVSLLTPLLATTAGEMTIQPVGDLVLDPGGSDVLPGGSVVDDLGDYNRKWRTLFAAELYVETLVAQDVLSTIGGRIEVTPTTTLIADLASGATTMDVKHNNLRSGEFAYLMAAPGGVAQFEAIKVNSAATAITGGYRYTIVRNQDGTGANNWTTGDAVASLGKNVSEGHISLTATSTAYNHLGPTIAIYSRNATTTWDAVTPVVAVGNLESFAGYSAATAGLAVGNDLTKTPTTGYKGLTADATNGLRMFSTAIEMYNAATRTMYIAPTGLEMWLGTSDADKRLSWDGTTFAILGQVTATSGYIGSATNGWTIDANSISANGIRLYALRGTADSSRIELGDYTNAGSGQLPVIGLRGVSSGTVATSTIAQWAGRNYANRSAAPYRLTYGGSLYASDATIAGSLTSTDATFGTLLVDTTGCFVEAPATFSSLNYGYKFKYGGTLAAGMFAEYAVNSMANLYLLNNRSQSSGLIASNANALIRIETMASDYKEARLVLSSKRAAGYTDITILNTSSARSVTFGADVLYVQPAGGGSHAVWHAGNDGAGTGLDADTLDGVQASAFAQLSGAIFTGAVIVGNTVRFGSAFAIDVDWATIPAGQIWMYMVEGTSGRKILRVRGKGDGGGQAEVTIITTGA